MAATTADGVVNHRGEVFDVTSGHDGPLLTITTLVERIADLMLRDPRNAARFQSPEVVR